MIRRCRRQRSGRFAALTSAFIAVGTVIAAPAAAEIPDASCVGPATANMADVRVAQPFTALNTGHLVRFEAVINNSGSPSNWVVQINAADPSGTPTNTTLAETAFPVPGTPAGSTPIGGSFTSPALVTAGERYALVVTDDGSNEPRATPDACPGNAFGSPSLNGGWDFSYTVDVIFATFVEPGDTQSPQTTITKHPKDKTKKKKATFEFTSSEPGSSFECSLNGAPFTSCTSPLEVKGKKRKNSFAVRAKDAAGNVDATPATFDWKVKKKKK